MNRIGPYLFVLTVFADLVAVIGFSLAAASVAAATWIPVAAAALAAGVPLALGAGWLSILWGARDVNSMLLLGVALLAHLFAITALAFSPIPAVLLWVAAVTTATDAIAAVYSFRAVEA